MDVRPQAMACCNFEEIELSVGSAFDSFFLRLVVKPILKWDLVGICLGFATDLLLLQLFTNYTRFFRILGYLFVPLYVPQISIISIISIKRMYVYLWFIELTLEYNFEWLYNGIVKV